MGLAFWRTLHEEQAKAAAERRPSVVPASPVEALNLPKAKPEPEKVAPAPRPLPEPVEKPKGRSRLEGRTPRTATSLPASHNSK